MEHNLRSIRKKLPLIAAVAAVGVATATAEIVDQHGEAHKTTVSPSGQTIPETDHGSGFVGVNQGQLPSFNIGPTGQTIPETDHGSGFVGVNQGQLPSFNAEPTPHSQQ